MPLDHTAWEAFCDAAHAAAHPPRTLPTAMQRASRAHECDRCLRLWTDHEVVTDRWGDVVRVCPPETDWWDTGRERAYRNRQMGY